MNTAFQPTGNEVKQAAFSEHRRSGQLSFSRRRVVNALAAGAKTRNQLANDTGLPLASVCGRCRELLDLGYIDVAGMSADSPARQMLSLTEEGRAKLDRATGGAA
ncbi:hypothetical protein [Vreelandella sp. EE22]